jgi:Zn-dependent oligopeptidase
MRTNDSEKIRESAYNGLRSIGPFVAEIFCQIIKKRNVLAKSLGYEDFYDMKVTQAEGFSKRVLFGILDDLEVKTRPILEKALDHLKASKGERAALPFNQGYFLSGDTTALKDPYFPFANAVDAWVRSFAALGISYENATMTLDLVDREGKYSNGFCHWPQPAWVDKGNVWIPSQANFTSLASPKSVGSGLTALTTLMHEGGHAAHFANVKQNSPLFSQERSPTSVAYAENQSMFLDSLVGDAAWQARYAISKEGLPISWDIIEQGIRNTHMYEVFGLRAMLAVPYFEKALYELPENQVTPENIIALADKIENSIQGGLSSRPLMSVPHILSDESAGYYHGYVLAEMSVHQTRAYFMSKYGELTDNPNVGRELTEVYWKPGNSEIFLDLVQKLTGKPLTADAWISALQEDVEEVVSSEKRSYEGAVAKGPTFPRGSNVDIKMRIKLVHGDLVIADSHPDGLFNACETYRKWIETL